MPALRHHLQLALLLAGLLVLATAAYTSGAFRAPASRSGSVNDALSGYTVSNVNYALSAGDPRRIAKVTFALDTDGGLAQGATVQAKIVRSSSAYSSCINIPPGSSTWECPVGGVAVAEADQLAVRVGGPPSPGYKLWLPIIRRAGL
ncbi:MAG TPA: hypothetical protein VFO07_08405 [Roseiflexaceae bacterium]|nr:hypothetical protein [Roseiflexaceae bacterium]